MYRGRAIRKVVHTVSSEKQGRVMPIGCTEFESGLFGG